jgi:hypothetical protein
MYFLMIDPKSSLWRTRLSETNWIAGKFSDKRGNHKVPENGDSPWTAQTHDQGSTVKASHSIGTLLERSFWEVTLQLALCAMLQTFHWIECGALVDSNKTDVDQTALGFVGDFTAYLLRVA